MPGATMDGMTPQEVKDLRRKLNLSATEFGAALGVCENTVRRWECGLREARGPAVVMMRRLAAEKAAQPA